MRLDKLLPHWWSSRNWSIHNFYWFAISSIASIKHSDLLEITLFYWVFCKIYIINRTDHLAVSRWNKETVIKIFKFFIRFFLCNMRVINILVNIFFQFIWKRPKKYSFNLQYLYDTVWLRQMKFFLIWDRW